VIDCHGVMPTSSISGIIINKDCLDNFYQLVFVYYIRSQTAVKTNKQAAMLNSTGMQQEAPLLLGWLTVLPHSRRSVQKLWHIYVAMLIHRDRTV